MRQLISIGRFSRLTDLSHAQLRKLDERGLLRPAFVDPDTHYRYYEYGQVRRASLVHLCLQLRLTPSRIRELIAADDRATLRSHLERHRAQLAGHLDDVTQMLALLDQVLARQEGPLTYHCAVRDVPAQYVAARRGRVTRQHPYDPSAVGRAERLAIEEILRWLADNGVTPEVRPLVLYYSDMERDKDLSFEVCIPLEEPVPESAGVACREIPPSRVAYTTHYGRYETILSAYAELHSWVLEHGYEVDGPLREVYLVHALDTPDSDQWVTEVAFPLAD